MTTITANSSIGIYLSTPTFVNPIVIDPGVTITGDYRGDAIYASSGSWTISNAGTVSGTGTKVGGIYLGAGGVVTNQATGVIGLPSSNSSDIYITGGAGTVTNYGSINAGVWLQSGGAVTNATGARIVSGDPNGGYGVGLHAGGTVTNAGLITGLLDGVDASHLGGTIINQAGGTITGQYVGALMGVVDYPAVAGRTVINQAGGTIIGDSGVLAGGSSATVTNAGAITGTFASTITHGTITLVVGSGVSMSAGGAVTNQSGGTISGISYGININGAAGTVFNAGLITATGATLSRVVALLDGGYLSNAATGVISSSGNGNAVRVQGAAGTIVNAGSLINDFAGRSAVALQAGGSVTNVAGGVIHAGAWNGIYGTGGAVGIVNAGAIDGGGSAHGGIQLLAGGSVTNAASASVTGPNGVDIGGSPGTVVNNGQVIGTGTISTVTYALSQPGRGIYLASGGAVTNAASGTISGGYIGVELRGIGTLSNDGNIVGTPGLSLGVVLTAGGGLITNAASGSIMGSLGILVDHGAPATIINDGRIVATGTSGKAHGIALYSVGAVTNAASASITGGIVGVDLAVGGTLTNAGTIIGNNGTAVSFGGTGSNQLVLDPGFGFSGAVDGSASASNTLELASASSAGSVTGLGTQFLNFGPIAFDTGADWFISGNTSGLAGAISGFALGDTIELTGITATGSSYVGGVLTLTEASGSATLTLPGSFTTGDFVVTNVAAGADVSLAAPCFVAGTRIGTGRGEVAVETLRVGELVLAHAGDGRMALCPVVWIGHRTLDCRRHPRPELVWPVRIAAGAFGPGQPHRDLWLSPDHAVFIDNALIPVKQLINCTTIEQVRLDEVTYHHVELRHHGVLLAEGLACESFLDTGHRHDFAHGGGAVALHPDFSSRKWEAEGCAPLIVAGPKLDAVRQSVNALAAARRAAVKPRAAWQ